MAYGLNIYQIINDAWGTYSGGAPLVQVKAPPKLEKGEVPDPDLHTPVYCAFPAGQYSIELTPDNEGEEVALNGPEGVTMTRAELVEALDAITQTRAAKARRDGMIERVSPHQITTRVTMAEAQELAELRAFKAQMVLRQAQDERVGGEVPVRITPDEFEAQLHRGQVQCGAEGCRAWVKRLNSHLYLTALNGKNLPSQHKAEYKRLYPGPYAKAFGGK